MKDLKMKEHQQTSRKYHLSKSQLDTLMYWAHVGASGSRGRQYKEDFPNRMTPYDKLNSIGIATKWYTR